MQPQIYVNVRVLPLRTEDLDFLSFQKLQPELYFAGEDVDDLTPEKLENIQKEIVDRKFQPCWHSPFFDLNMGASDPRIRQVSEERILWAIRSAKQFGAKQIVIHPGYGPYTLGKNFDKWHERAKPMLSNVVTKAAENGVRIAFENIFDQSPDDLASLLASFPKETAGVCFDLGHFNLFSETAMKSWLETLGQRIFEIHLHDNHGIQDDHIAIGDGTIKFLTIVNWLRPREEKPILTLEMEQKTHIIKSVQRVREWFVEDFQSD